MLVQKFGGSSLTGVKGFLAAAGIISSAAAKQKVVAVLSAVYGITDQLESAISAAANGENFRDVLVGIHDNEQELLRELHKTGLDCPVAKDFLAEQQQRLISRLEGVALLEHCPPRFAQRCFRRVKHSAAG